jgi:8-oxo-dGTP diphosphatase
MNPHDTFFITVRGIIFKDGKLFCQKLKHEKPGKITQINDFWATPGGHLDAGESLEVGLRREMVEETGVTPKIGPLLFTQQYRADNGGFYVEFFYHIINADDYETIDLATTTHGEFEVAEYGFINPDASNILPKFLTCKNIEAAIKNGTVTNYSYL